MKMVKSLLLGTAAGLVAMTGAQAADLPVKAKPVQYVKICSLYGAGFYYIPGTDMCLKIGGSVRFEMSEHGGNSMTNAPFGTASGFQNTRTDTSDFNMRSRNWVTFDARQQTEYGTLRSYLNVGWTTDTTNTGSVDGAAKGVYANRAFVQIAGFTFGTAQSFYDFYSGPAVAYWAAVPLSDTGDGGVKMVAYTAQFGGGLSATLALEEPRRGVIITPSFASTVATTAAASFWAMGGVGAPGTTNAEQNKFPDVVGTLRVDQAWGSAQLMGAIHDNSGGYYSTAANGSPTGMVGLGHPGDNVGWAAGAGVRINAPSIGPGDYFQTQINYTVGAGRYAAASAGAYSPAFFGPSNAFGFGFQTDGVFVTGGGVQNTTSWGVAASYEHFWNKQWRTSAYAGYYAQSYNSTATAALCGSAGAIGAAGAGGLVGCDMDWSWWWVGTRTQWNITPDTYMGLDVIYNKLQSAQLNSAGTYALGPASGAIPAQAGTNKDQDSWSFRFRVHRDFYP